MLVGAQERNDVMQAGGMEGKARVLVASADRDLSEAARLELVGRGYSVILAADEREAARQLTAARAVDAVFVDSLDFGDLGFIRAVRESPAHPEVLLLADEVTDVAHGAAEIGADICSRPPDWQIAEERLRRALEARSMRERIERAIAGAPGRSLGELGPSLLEVIQRHERAARTSVPIFIVGRPGTPRAAVAQAIHQQSGRGHRPFVEVDCRGLEEPEAEAMLFAIGRLAVQTHEGAFESAVGGTVYLEDVDHLSDRLQAMLARTMERRAVLKPGGREEPIDVRVLCSAAGDLKPRVDAGAFRADLLYRLAGISLRVPSLGSRRAEVPTLVRSVLTALAGPRHVELGASALEALCEYDWPGNEREVELVLARALLVTDVTTLEAEHLFLASGPPGAQPAAEGEVLSFEAYEERAMRAALEQTGGNVTQAAKILGIGRATFYRKSRKFGLEL